MHSESPAVLANKLIEAGIVDSGDLIGCTDAEIANLESQMSVHLPIAYKEFLQTWGKEDGDYLSDCSYLYASLNWVRTAAEGFATRHNFTLKRTWFVFLVRDGMFLCFDTADGDDPPVFRYVQGGEAGFEKVYDRFSFWLTDMVNTDIAALNESSEPKP